MSGSFFVRLAIPSHLGKKARTVRLTVATNVTATLRVSTHKLTVGPQARTFAVPIKAGRAPLRLALTLIAHGKQAAETLVIKRS